MDPLPVRVVGSLPRTEHSSDKERKKRRWKISNKTPESKQGVAHTAVLLDILVY